MKTKILLFFIMVLPSLSQTSIPQNDSLRSRYGAFGHYGINLHSADFKKIPDCPSCSPGYETGIGTGLSLGILWEYPINQSFLFGLRASYWDYSAKLTRTEPTTLIVGGTDINGEFEHTLKSTLASVGLEPTINYIPFKNFNVFAGFHAGSVIIKKYEQQEMLIKPDGAATFLDAQGNDSHSRIRNNLKGDLSKASALNIAGLFGVSYDLQINKSGTLILAPEAMFLYGLTKIVNSDSVNKWQSNSVRAGIALKYSPKPSKELIENFEKNEKIDTIRIESDNVHGDRFTQGIPESKKEITQSVNIKTTTEYYSRTDTIYTKKKYSLLGAINAVGVDESGKEIPNPIFKIEEFISNRLDPLLNFVFFEENSSALPDRYIAIKNSQTDKFFVDSLYRETTIDIYLNIMNIVGKRMTVNPSANITLIGCNSDLTTEKGNSDLSQKRAETVRDYLTNIWNISSSRIKIEKRNLPSKPSTPKDEPDKIQENRRVEIYSDNTKILEPVFIEKIDRAANPPFVRFKAEASAEAGLKNWSINSYQNSDKDNKFNATGESVIPTDVDWKLDLLQKIIPKSPEPIIYLLQLEDKKGNKKVIDKKSLPIEVTSIQKKRIEKQGDYEIDRFSLILFDFDKTTIDGGNKMIIDFISSRIKPESEIEISGYTDRTGDAEYNKNLSERRSQATKKALKSTNAKAVGIGEEQLLYNNDIPEGRFYCRTVNVVVKTKVK